MTVGLELSALRDPHGGNGMSEENVAQEAPSNEQDEQHTSQAQEATEDTSPEELKSYVEALKAKKQAVDAENKSMRARLKEYDAARQAAEDSTKSVEQKLTEQLETANSRYQTLLQRTIDSEATNAATGLVVDPKIALRLLDVSEFVTEDGLDKDSFQKAVKNLVKDHAYLAPGDVERGTSTARGPKPDPTQASAANSKAPTDERSAFAAAIRSSLHSQR